MPWKRDVDLKWTYPAGSAGFRCFQKSRFRFFVWGFCDRFKCVSGGGEPMRSDWTDGRQAISAAVFLVVAAWAGACSAWGAGGRWVVEDQRGTCVLYSEFSIPPADVWRELEEVSALLEQSAGIVASTERVEVVLFASQSSYLKYLSQGLPQARNRRALFYRNAGVSQIYAWKSRSLMTDLRHEMVHVRVHQHLPFAPLWLDEGLAECFEERAGSRVDVTRREQLRWRARVNQVGSLRVLERLPSAEAMDGDDYRNSWAWTAFLLQESEESRNLLRTYIAEIHRGEAPGAFSSWADARVPSLLPRANSYFRKMPPSLNLGLSSRQNGPGD